MTEKRTFDEALLLTAEEVSRRLLATPPVIRRLTTHLSKASGKHIRAQSVLACAMEGSGLIPGDAVYVAAAVELLHLATLVHDDIIDGASTRRGLMTLHRRFGEKPAILCGDYLFCLSLELAAGVEPHEDRKELFDKTLTHYMSDILLGEMRQDQNNRNYALSERQYFEIIGGKTAAMFEASFFAGFLLSDEPGGLGDTFKTVGRSIGLIFQLADDCADYESTRRSTKKPVLSDIKTGVVTLPLIYALKRDAGLRDKLSGGAGPATLKKAVASAGGLDYTRLKIREFFVKTQGLINGLPSAATKKDLLAALLRRAAGFPEALS